MKECCCSVGIAVWILFVREDMGKLEWMFTLVLVSWGRKEWKREW